MNKQQSQTKGNQSSAKKTDSSRYGFEPIPATAEVDGASGGNELTGRTAAEVMGYYTAEKMHEHAVEEGNTVNASATSEEDVFNPVLDSVSEVTKE
ncbi:MAG: hypothetical protein M3033_03450 [Acidobacteriota bacterium]|nr:hypothetical protein [Acidobacteriota bacterium]